MASSCGGCFDNCHTDWSFIYGFIFAIIAGLFLDLFGWFLGRWRGMLAAFLGMSEQVVLARAGAHMVRADIMVGIESSPRRSGAGRLD
jgi:hypothetical protein